MLTPAARLIFPVNNQLWSNDDDDDDNDDDDEEEEVEEDEGVGKNGEKKDDDGDVCWQGWWACWGYW